MRLLHYSTKALTDIYSVEQCLNKRHDKPKGLWVSVEGERDWKEWCTEESFWDIDSKIVQEIFLSPEANILYLSCSLDLDTFTEEYGFNPYSEISHRGIRWDMVAREYHGVIIAPYVLSRRLEGTASDWYYGWDCASGCIWDAKAVSSVKEIAS